MHIGVPRETKPAEGRVGLIPGAVKALVDSGHQVSVEHTAGVGSGYSDEDYLRAGAHIAADARALYGAAGMIIKVKEPYGTDLDFLQSHHLLFCFLHLAAMPELAERLCEIGLTAVGFETVQDQGRLPILAPMSEVAGKIAVQAGTHYLHASMGGRGIMLGGLDSTESGHVVVLGAGNAGAAAARLAASIGAEVTVFDSNPDKLSQLNSEHRNITARMSAGRDIAEAVTTADLLVGSILVPGKKATHLVSREQVANMSKGSVIVDIAVDQGGCIETTRPTTYEDPVFIDEGVLHFGVTNMPGAVPRTSSAALSAALLPYAQQLAREGVSASAVLEGAINVAGGAVVHPALM